MWAPLTCCVASQTHVDVERCRDKYMAQVVQNAAELERLFLTIDHIEVCAMVWGRAAVVA